MVGVVDLQYSHAAVTEKGMCSLRYSLFHTFHVPGAKAHIHHLMQFAFIKLNIFLVIASYTGEIPASSKHSSGHEYFLTPNKHFTAVLYCIISFLRRKYFMAALDGMLYMLQVTQNIYSKLFSN